MPELNGPPIANDWTLAFANPLTRQAYEYWNSTRGARAMPEAADLSLRGMRAFVTHTMRVEVRPRAGGGHDFEIRIAGEDVKRVYGDIRHKSLEEFLSPDTEQRWRLGFEAAAEKKAPLRNHGSIAFEGKQWLDYEALVAPLGSGDEVTGLFVVFISWPRKA